MTGDGGSCRDRVAKQVLAAGLAHWQAPLWPLTAAYWPVSEPTPPGKGMAGGKERGVFVLSRELHEQLPQHFY